MATGTPMIASSLPNFIVVKSNHYSDEGYAYYKENEGSSNSVLLGEASVFSTLVKIELEFSAASDKYVSLRFCYSNRFWTKGDDSKFLVADVDQPQEDVTKASCTLFQAFQVGEEDSGEVYLVHVQSGGRLLIDSNTWGFYVEENSKDDQGYLSFVDWETLIQLPTNVAFIGYNGKYLRHFKNLMVQDAFVFDSEDTNEDSRYTVELMEDGYVQIMAESGDYWMIGIMIPSRMVGNYGKTTDPSCDFWPIKLDVGTVAFRNKKNNCFCAADNDDNGITLYASATSLMKEARLQVTELVLGRKIYNVRYLMEYARIYNEAPFVAGTAVLINDTDQEAILTANVSYDDSKSYTYSRGTSFTAGVKTEIACGVPFFAEGKIEVSFEISGTFQWDTTTTTTTNVGASAGIPVPPMTTTAVEYAGTKGTCNLPYTYTQEDQSSIDGQTSRTNMIDGIYNGVSYYDFSFHVISNKPIQP